MCAKFAGNDGICLFDSLGISDDRRLLWRGRPMLDVIVWALEVYSNEPYKVDVGL
jgi:hypothetical protein